MSKRALIVGINYPGTDNELRGCVNDALAMQKFLESKGYQCLMLLDAAATRVAILREFYELILSDSDVLYFHYSGHGGSVRDQSGDEEDGKDETLCPVDFQEAGMIIDDELRGLLTSLVDKQMTITLDCCHSGTGVDLSYNAIERLGRVSLEKGLRAVSLRGEVVCISGCKDAQTSADAQIAGTFQGALTNALLPAMQSKSWADLWKSVNKTLRTSKYSQISCLSAGSDLDLSARPWI